MKLNRDPILLISLGALVVLGVLEPEALSSAHKFVHWETILTLSGLLIITTALEESGLFSRLAYRMLSKVTTERSLALLLISFSAGLSTFLTNDITLFITVPLTLGLRDFMENDITKLIIFEALAVNVGSFLTPIGNPQNIFLWHSWNVRFFYFVKEVFPAQITSFFLLLLFTAVSFPSKKLIKRDSDEENLKLQGGLFALSILALIIFVAAVELDLTLYATGIVVLAYLIFSPKTVYKANWNIILLLIILFADVRLLYLALQNNLGFIVKMNSSPAGTYLSSLILSQIISNVPAAIFLEGLTSFKKALVIGVNIGGNGTVIASLANVIALNLGRTKAWLKFHYYSFVFLLASSLVVFLLFF